MRSSLSSTCASLSCRSGSHHTQLSLPIEIPLGNRFAGREPLRPTTEPAEQQFIYSHNYDKHEKDRVPHSKSGDCGFRSQYSESIIQVNKGLWPYNARSRDDDAQRGNYGNRGYTKRQGKHDQSVIPKKYATMAKPLECRSLVDWNCLVGHVPACYRRLTGS